MGKYQIIYADPPWTYNSKQDQRAGKPIHYATLTVKDLAELPVKEISAENCVLFLWVPPALLPYSFVVAESWGFQYKTKAFCWVKTNKKSNTYFFGQGYWTRPNSEDCLLFVKGKSHRIGTRVHQIVESPTIISKLQEPSKKPDIIREKIVELMGDLPRIELFARQKYEGWDALGNEIDGKDIRDSIKDAVEATKIFTFPLP